MWWRLIALLHHHLNRLSRFLAQQYLLALGQVENDLRCKVADGEQVYMVVDGYLVIHAQGLYEGFHFVFPVIYAGNKADSRILYQVDLHLQVVEDAVEVAEVVFGDEGKVF